MYVEYLKYNRVDAGKPVYFWWVDAAYVFRNRKRNPEGYHSIRSKAFHFHLVMETDDCYPLTRKEAIQLCADIVKRNYREVDLNS